MFNRHSWTDVVSKVFKTQMSSLVYIDIPILTPNESIDSTLIKNEHFAGNSMTQKAQHAAIGPNAPRG